MRKFKLPVTSVNLVSLINDMRTQAATKLSAFCSNQILEKRLSTKTFKYDFDVAGRRAGGQKKSLQKLREILYKHVKKQIPYLEYVKSGETFMFSSANRSNQVGFKLESPYIKVDLDPTSYDPNRVAANSRWMKSMYRYARYLNYKAIRSGTPLNCVITGLSVSTHPSDIPEYDTWLEKRRGVKSIRVKISMKFMIDMVGHEYPHYVNTVRGAATYKTYAEYEQFLNISAGPDADRMRKAFTNPDNWVNRQLTGPHVGVYPGHEKYNTAEKIFLALDEMIKVIVTLTRRVQYDTAAFNIGSSEAS